MAAGMASANGQREYPAPRPVSALPSVRARLLAFGAILVGGLCGGLIGSSTVAVGCHGSCATPEGVGGVIGAVVAAAGVAVIAVLVLRAMGEWRSIKEKRQIEAMVAAASQALSYDATGAPPTGSTGPGAGSGADATGPGAGPTAAGDDLADDGDQGLDGGPAPPEP